MAALVPVHIKPPEHLEPGSREYIDGILAEVRRDTRDKVHARLEEEAVGTGRRQGQSEEKEIGRRSADKRVVRATVSRNSR